MVFDELEVVESAPSTLPGNLELGEFSVSLAVSDLDVSRVFYEALGFVITGGDAEAGWLVLRNGETTLGLFAGMFEKNILTFNPGLTSRMQRIANFTDVREIEARLRQAGIEIQAGVSPEAPDAGPGHISLVDPDGNPILIDQFF